MVLKRWGLHHPLSTASATAGVVVHDRLKAAREAGGPEFEAEARRATAVLIMRGPGGFMAQDRIDFSAAACTLAGCSLGGIHGGVHTPRAMRRAPRATRNTPRATRHTR